MVELFKFLDMQQIRQDLETWVAAIQDPQQFMKPAFEPTTDQFATAFEFYFRILLATLLIYMLVVLFSTRDTIGVKFKMLASGLLGMIFFFVAAAAMHIPFSWLGGKASFLGTCTAYIYAAVPFAPLLAIAQWIMIAGMPAPLRRFALNPGTAYAAGHASSQHEDTDKVTYFLGSLLILGLFGWLLFVVFRSVSYVHDLGGWWLALAIFLSWLVSIPLGLVNQRMGSHIFGEPELA